MNKDSVRDTMFAGEPTRSKFDEEEVCQFLLLLKQQNGLQADEDDEINKKEWRIVVNQVKMQRSSPAFSTRGYSVHECALQSERMVDVLVTFYNFVIKFNNFPERWLKVVDTLIEKRKVPRINKSIPLEMIEADMQSTMRIYLGNRIENKVEEDKKNLNVIIVHVKDTLLKRHC